jgi:hypothetical protein
MVQTSAARHQPLQCDLSANLPWKVHAMKTTAMTLLAISGATTWAAWRAGATRMATVIVLLRVLAGLCALVGLALLLAAHV